MTFILSLLLCVNIPKAFSGGYLPHRSANHKLEHCKAQGNIVLSDPIYKHRGCS